jgi:2-polyprenyl-6-methoxyphenol hydroxylase-like FAD-dependent oxidoreductase
MSTRHYADRHIGIIGAGIAGLHLGLRLQRLGIDCTIITDRTPEQVAAAQLTNMVVHWPATLRRERVLGVHHWPVEEFGFSSFHNAIQTPEPIDIHFHAAHPARAVDYRIYLPQLMEDFVARRGRLEVRSLNARDIGDIAERFDLVVVAMPGNGFRDLFARDDANSPYDRPQRFVLAGLYHGFRPVQAHTAAMSIAPDHGEAMTFPLLSRTGLVNALAIVAYQPDELAMLRVLSGSADQAGYCSALLHELERHHPTIYDRIDTARFSMQGPGDLAQAAITPVVRRPYVDLGSGTYAIALGDVHVTVDPLLAQGANIGSYSAFVLADAIAEARAFDLAFCREVERSRSARILGAARWTNVFLQPPDEARMELIVAMSRDGQLADEYYDNFNCPERQWQRVRSAETIRDWLAERQVRSPEHAAAMASA